MCIFCSTFVLRLHWALGTSWPTYDTHSGSMASKRASRTHLCCLGDAKTWRTSRNNWPIWGKLKYDCIGCLFVNNNSSNCLTITPPWFPLAIDPLRASRQQGCVFSIFAINNILYAYLNNSSCHPKSKTYLKLFQSIQLPSTDFQQLWCGYNEQPSWISKRIWNSPCFVNVPRQKLKNYHQNGMSWALTIKVKNKSWADFYGMSVCAYDQVRTMVYLRGGTKLLVCKLAKRRRL